jgi:hypothetical protein
LLVHGCFSIKFISKIIPLLSITNENLMSG